MNDWMENDFMEWDATTEEINGTLDSIIGLEDLECSTIGELTLTLITNSTYSSEEKSLISRAYDGLVTILKRIKDAVVAFFKKIYNFLFGWLHETEESDDNPEKSSETIDEVTKDTGSSDTAPVKDNIDAIAAKKKEAEIQVKETVLESVKKEAAKRPDAESKVQEIDDRKDSGTSDVIEKELVKAQKELADSKKAEAKQAKLIAELEEEKKKDAIVYPIKLVRVSTDLLPPNYDKMDKGKVIGEFIEVVAEINEKLQKGIGYFNAKLEDSMEELDIYTHELAELAKGKESTTDFKDAANKIVMPPPLLIRSELDKLDLPLDMASKLADVANPSALINASSLASVDVGELTGADIKNYAGAFVDMNGVINEIKSNRHNLNKVDTHKALIDTKHLDRLLGKKAAREKVVHAHKVARDLNKSFTKHVTVYSSRARTLMHTFIQVARVMDGINKKLKIISIDLRKEADELQQSLVASSRKDMYSKKIYVKNTLPAGTTERNDVDVILDNSNSDLFDIFGD